MESNGAKPVISSTESGTAKIVLWKDRQFSGEDLDTTSFDWGVGFYDFHKPLNVLRSGSWSSVLEGQFQEGFYVLSEKLRDS